jgi:hypothetical protein
MSGRRSPAAPAEGPVVTAPGARPAAVAPAGCARCHHPFALHSNGESACRAFACSAGEPVECPQCRGRGQIELRLAGADPIDAQCDACRGKGAVAPCPEFVPAAVSEEPEDSLLAS